MKSRRLAVLLITKTKEKGGSGSITVGKSEPTITYRGEMENYCELLSSSNILFDIIGEKELSESTFVDENTIKYVAAIFTIPFSAFSDRTLCVINEASRKLGISLIAAYNHSDERSKRFFGIMSFMGKRLLWPLRVKIIRWPKVARQEEVIASYSLISGIPGVRKKGLRKLSAKQTCTKAVRLLRSLILPYLRVGLDSGANVLATDTKGRPLAWSFQFVKATNYYFALHEGIFLDKFNEMHHLVRAAIEANSGFGMVSVNLENTMVLRLDDPGACSADYLDNGGILQEKEWEELSKILENREIPLSVMYTPGWVDDGDKKSGRLFINEKEITERRAGTIYDSARVRYVPSRGKNGTYDHASEFRGLKKAAEKGFADVHSHGLTHLDPDHKSWAKAKDRNKNTQWYHEFYHLKDGRSVESDEQKEAMAASRDKIFNLFGVSPLTITPSGHRHGDECDLLSRDAGYLIFSADYTGILKKNILIRNWKIPSLFLYLKSPSSFAFKSGYPFIGIIHDYEIKQHGVDSLIEVIEGWQSRGIRRFISLQELAVNLCVSVVGYWFENEKKFRILISAPAANGIENVFSKLPETKIKLRVIPPSGVEALADKLSIVGSNLTIVPPAGEFSASNDVPLCHETYLKSSDLLLCLNLSGPRIGK